MVRPHTLPAGAEAASSHHNLRGPLADYPPQFYRRHGETALASARRIVPIVLDLLSPQRVIDIGCGGGAWLAIFREHGVDDVLGLDGVWVDEDQLRIPRDRFRRTDLQRPLDVEGGFDLALSLEVAEHLPPARAEGFIAELAALAPVVLFSAAIPFQGGHHHVNEQWPDYWAGHFKSHRFEAIDIIRFQVWNDPEVSSWYKQNILIFARDDAIRSSERLRDAWRATPKGPLALVHPEFFLGKVKGAHPGFGRWLRMAPKTLKRSLGRRLGRRGARTP